ncbi:hypothetical protein MiSe_73690 [Microseira wollei NIES-4236]|uniref:Transposase n=1 Tax=Microseira wollei NIES-4236 TaxID=2530354 RepID=A0AAV3XP07_9CYAN|nr:hypothetical protein [Microseira wollei]GET42551.1 hypothetical protein MiSe_73690 [Microseira wollei NIES-4236]
MESLRWCGARERYQKAQCEEGREEGMRQKAIAIARQLLDRLDDETISQTTGLSLSEVRRLR